MGKTFKDSRGHSDINSRKYRHMPDFTKNHSRLTRCYTGKVGFPTEIEAQNRAGEILASGNNRGTTAFRVYCCEYCNYYHLTSRV